MTGIPAEQAPTLTVGALPPASPSLAALAAQNGEVQAAIRTAQKMLAAYGDTTGFDIGQYAQGYGALAESLRILLRALDAEPTCDFLRSQEVPGSRKNPSDRRCPAAHAEDPTGCNGPVAVTILDAHNAGADGCEHHAARMLASLDGGRVYPLPDAADGAAIRVFKAADRVRPFPWVNGPRTRDEQLSRDEVRKRGERP
ncbi:hypothetical protein ABT300_05500 [Streptomyces sp. NPDC001027]|uniref:hypothetical protein n=1 Tax=Streptomyces sp. NPDC001027 TaxID=3154771 RepID=UPI003333B226